MIKKYEKTKIKGWNHIPKVPISVSPFFSWPLSPKKMFTWVLERWLTLTENVIILAFAFLTYFFLQPSMETTIHFSIDWIVGIWVRNILLLSLVAGTLHWFFYMRKGQGNRLKYDIRELDQTGKKYLFGGQVRDNIFWSLISGAGVWTFYEVIIFWSLSNGYAPTLLIADHPIVFALWFFLTPLWISFHFYWTHRLLHWRPLYRKFHSVHHRNVNVGPWSGISMHPIEHLIFFSSIFIHFLIPTSIIHVLFHMQHQALQGVSSHTGYESLLLKDRKRLGLGTFHHQMHHRYFDVNYGTLEIPWDKWFGTFHDGTVSSHESIKNHRQ